MRTTLIFPVLTIAAALLLSSCEQKSTTETSTTPAAAPATTAAPAATPAQAVTYTCSMHPEVVSDKPGKCPKCGMDLVKK